MVVVASGRPGLRCSTGRPEVVCVVTPRPTRCSCGRRGCGGVGWVCVRPRCLRVRWLRARRRGIARGQGSGCGRCPGPGRRWCGRWDHVAQATRRQGGPACTPRQLSRPAGGRFRTSRPARSHRRGKPAAPSRLDACSRPAPVGPHGFEVSVKVGVELTQATAAVPRVVHGLLAFWSSAG